MSEIYDYLRTNGIEIGEDEFEATPATVIKIAEIFGYDDITMQDTFTLTLANGNEILVKPGVLH